MGVVSVARHRRRRSAGSELALETLRIAAARDAAAGDAGHDVLLFAFEGGGALAGDPLASRLRGLPAGGRARPSSTRVRTVSRSSASRSARETDLHAPMGTRERIVAAAQVEPGKATGSRSFQVLFGPHNGCMRATMFVGYVPPGAAPWHYHLYDEIVWIWRGPGPLSPRRRHRAARGRLGVPDHATRGAHRREHAARIASSRARDLHAGGKPLGGIPDA